MREINQPVDEMLARISAIDATLEQVGLTGDAAESLQAGREVLLGEFTLAAEYAETISEETGVEFYNPFNNGTSETDSNPDVLSPEEKQFKESLLEGFEVSYDTYATLLDVMNTAKDRKENKLELASEEEAKEAVETLLTPGVIREAMRQMEEFSVNPEENSPEVGFDIILAPNEDLNASDETVVAKHIQSKLKDAYSGNDYVYEPFHNRATAHWADATGASIVAALAPRHLNIRKGEKTVTESGEELTPTESQGAVVRAQNEQLEQDGVELVTSGIDTFAMTHIARLIEDGAIDTKDGNYLQERFWATYYKDVLAAPADGGVPLVCVGGYGRFYRGVSYVDLGRPSRALVVNKL